MHTTVGGWERGNFSYALSSVFTKERVFFPEKVRPAAPKLIIKTFLKCAKSKGLSSFPLVLVCLFPSPPPKKKPSYLSDLKLSWEREEVMADRKVLERGGVKKVRQSTLDIRSDVVWCSEKLLVIV